MEFAEFIKTKKQGQKHVCIINPNLIFFFIENFY